MKDKQLSDSLLELVNGGKLTSDAYENAKYYVETYKKNGLSLSECLNDLESFWDYVYMDYSTNSSFKDMNDIEKYIRSIW